MACNHGKLTRDLIARTLSVGDSVTIDSRGDAQFKGDVTIKGGMTVKGPVCAPIYDKLGWQLYQKVKDATVSILIDNSSCSGWFINADGWIATAAHCVLEGDTLDDGGIVDVEDVCVTVTDGTTTKLYQPTKILVDGAGDLAVMHIPLSGNKWLEWGDSTQQCIGNRCFVVGNPLGLDSQSISDGLIRDNMFISSAVPTEVMLVSAPTFPGNSGSPVINEQCQVVGKISFGVPVPLEVCDKDFFMYTGYCDNYLDLVAISPTSTFVGGTSSRILRPVAESMVTQCVNYTNKGYLGFRPWFPLDAYNAKDLSLPNTFCLRGIRVNVRYDSPALSAVSGPDLPESDQVVILEVDGVPVGSAPGHTQISTVTWFKTPGQTVELKWIEAPSTTVQTSVVTLAAYPADQEGLSFGGLAVEIPPLMNRPFINADIKAATELASSTYATRDPDSWPGWQHLSRLTAPAYADGLSAPSGPTRPNPRTISNLVCDTTSTGIPNDHNATDFFWLWGQFVDHDIDLTPGKSPAEPFNIPVPIGDPMFDPTSTGTVVIPLERSDYDPSTGTTNPRQQINFISSFIDATNVYGTSSQRVNWLRSFIGGKLKTSAGGTLPPLSDGVIDNAVSPQGQAPFVVGDVRGNEQVLLLTMHTIWMREHNWWASRIAAADPSLGDEAIFQRARVMVESLVQHITWDEFLVTLLGSGSLPAYTGYKPATDTRVATEFSTAAFRLGHSLVSNSLWRLQPNGDPSPLGHLALADAFFAPDRFANEGGTDPLLRGAAKRVCQKLDSKVVPALRNFLFGPPGAGGLDLVSLNIQRGRDHGIADYNTVRVALGLGAKATFADITSDTAVQAGLSAAYAGDISLVDLWVGGICEDHLPGSQLGQTFHHIVLDQFTRLRDGDALWYENRLSPQLQAYVKNTSLADVIRRNTSIARTEIQDFVMKL